MPLKPRESSVLFKIEGQEAQGIEENKEDKIKQNKIK